MTIVDPVGTVSLSDFRINAGGSRFIAVCRCRGLFDQDKFATGPEGHDTLEEATRALAGHIVERHRADIADDTEDAVYEYLMGNWKKGGPQSRPRPHNPVLRSSVPYTQDDLATRQTMSSMFSRAFRGVPRALRGRDMPMEVRVPEEVLTAWRKSTYGGAHIEASDTDSIEVYT